MSVSFSGFAEKLLTFKNASAITAGYPVKVSANDTVAACSAGESFCGIAVESDSEYISVKVSGVITASYSGTAPTVGYAKLAGAASGKVAVAASGGREYLVLAVNSTDSTLTFIL